MQEQVLRGHPSRKVDERLRLGRCDTFFYSCFLGLPSSMTTDQGYIREVSAVSEPLQSLPPTSLSTSSSNLKLFLITRGRRRRATFEASSSHFLSSILGPCGAHQVNARAVVERGHPSRKVHERLRLGGCETFFYSCFANISAPK